jgi:biotin/methionine sulfoxide reductase
MADIAARLGAADAFTEGRDARDWLAHLCGEAAVRRARAGIELPDVDSFRAAVGVRTLKRPELPVRFAAFRADPETNALEAPNGRLELHSKRIASLGCDDSPGHPSASSPPNGSARRTARAIRGTCCPSSQPPRCTASPATPSTAS